MEQPRSAPHGTNSKTNQILFFARGEKKKGRKPREAQEEGPAEFAAEDRNRKKDRRRTEEIQEKIEEEEEEERREEKKKKSRREREGRKERERKEGKKSVRVLKVCQFCRRMWVNGRRTLLPPAVNRAPLYKRVIGLWNQKQRQMHFEGNSTAGRRMVGGDTSRTGTETLRYAIQFT